MRAPRSGAWRVYSRTPWRKLIACWSNVFVIDRFNTETDEHQRARPIERPSRPRVKLHRAPGSVPIVVPKCGRSTFLFWKTIREFQRKANFIAALIEVSELDAKSRECFGLSWDQSDYAQSLEILCQIGKEQP